MKALFIVMLWNVAVLLLILAALNVFFPPF